MNKPEGFQTTLKLEAGHCFTVLMNSQESELPELMESLEFTVWSPECYTEMPKAPCDLLAFISEEMRVYHVPTEAEFNTLLNNKNADFKICGIKPRSEKTFALEGISFCDELPVELLDFTSSDFELTHFALNDLCQLIIPFSAQENHKNYVDLTEAFRMHLSRVLPRIVRALTDEFDPESAPQFEKEILDIKALEQRKIFYGLFFDRFLKKADQNKRELFTELMYQRSACMEVFTTKTEWTKSFQSVERTLKPILTSIDIELYRNFIYSYHSINLS